MQAKRQESKRSKCKDNYMSTRTFESLTKAHAVTKCVLCK